MGQTHMLVFIGGCLTVWFILFFEKSLTHIASKIWRSCSSGRNKKSQVGSRLRATPAPAELDTPGGPASTPGQSQTPGEDGAGDYIYSDDIFNEFNFKQLYNELKKIRQEKQRVLIQRTKNRFTALQLKKYVDDYIAVIERNEHAVYKRLRKLTDEHIEMIEGVEPDMMTETEKIKTVLEYYNQATDKNNPLREQIQLEDGMHGRFLSKVQSYDLMDNQKYKDIDQLLDLMSETFGFNEDLGGLVKNSIS